MLKVHEHGLVNKKKFGFEKKHSTSHGSFQFIDQWVNKFDERKVFMYHYVKSVYIWSFSGLCFPAFGLNTGITIFEYNIFKSFSENVEKKLMIVLLQKVK